MRERVLHQVSGLARLPVAIAPSPAAFLRGNERFHYPVFQSGREFRPCRVALVRQDFSAANPSIGAIVRAQSTVAPRVTKALTGMPCAICGQMRFCVLIASSRARRMRVNPAMAGVDHQPCGVRLVNRNFRRSFPHAIIAPAGEASAGVAPAPGAESGSRHGAPARITRKTALAKRRLLRAPPPRLPSRPGKRGSGFSQTESEISRRPRAIMDMCSLLAVEDK